MSNQIELIFPLTNGGKEDGFNDSGIETFLGRPNYYMAREPGQNVGDVARGEVKTVSLHFDVIDVPATDIPCLEQLKNAFEASLNILKDPKGIAFFKNALKQIKKPNIKVLKISDFGTTGLKGSDDDRGGGWYGLIRSEGVTNKFSGDEGGGFGIGKYATFAGSGFRTVLYSTRTEDGNVGFQGVSHLVSHPLDDQVTQGTGYIGYYDSSKFKFSAVRDESAIPEFFRRKEIGLDIYVLDFLHSEDWETALTQSILENFWPAIHFEKIQFNVGETLIDKNALPDLMNRFSADEDFEAFYHYQSVVSVEQKHFETDLKHLGKVELYLVKGGNEKFPKSIARVRKSGMVIDKRNSRSRVPYAGLFVCSNPKGNRLLKKMEPPRHDEFQPEREPENGKKAIDELNRWLAKCVKELNPILNSITLDIPELYKYLPDTSDEDNDFEESDSNTQSDESFVKAVREDKPEVSSSAQLSVHTANVNTDDDKGTGGSGGKDENVTEEGKGGTGSGSGAGKGGGKEEGGNDGPNPKGTNRYINIQTRTIATSNPTFPITVCLRPSESFNGGIILCAVGEDGSDTPLVVSKAALSENPQQELKIKDGNEIANLKLSKSKPTRINLALDSQNKIAIKVTGKRK